MIKTSVVFVALTCLNLNAYAWFLAPSNSLECAKKYTKNVYDERVAKGIVQTCVFYFEAKTDMEKKRAECIIEGLSQSKTYVAGMIAVQECSNKF